MNVIDYFQGVQDPRVVGRCKHKLSDILVVALASYLCGAEDYESMHELCLERGKSLRLLVELPHGLLAQILLNVSCNALSPIRFMPA